MYTVSYFEGAIALLVLFILHNHYRRKTLQLPPGPKGLPLIGNVLDMPVERAWETFTKWGEKYGVSNMNCPLWKCSVYAVLVKGPSPRRPSLGRTSLS